MNIFNDYTILHRSPPRLHLLEGAGWTVGAAGILGGRPREAAPAEPLGQGQCVEEGPAVRKRTPTPGSGSASGSQNGGAEAHATAGFGVRTDRLVGGATGPLGEALIR